jgi:16S rRNA (adenine1518-N6/adenine1519-N6)-dimethyltransferase
MSQTSEALPELDIPGLLRQHGLRPNKRLGQNFLTDTAALRRILAATQLGENETVLEIGAGVGSLTRHLCQAARRVIAVELDSGLFTILEQTLAAFRNVRLIHGDILEMDPAELSSGSRYCVVANIPYYITSALLRHLMEASLRPDRLVLTVQREVATRLTADPGRLSLLALSVQVFGRAKVVASIPAGCFYPAPKVDSAVIRVDLFPSPAISEPMLPAFFQLTKAGFGQKRKTLRNALAAGLNIEAAQVEQLLLSAGLESGRRAETLDLAEWTRLVQAFLRWVPD